MPAGRTVLDGKLAKFVLKWGDDQPRARSAFQRSAVVVEARRSFTAKAGYKGGNGSSYTMTCVPSADKISTRAAGGRAAHDRSRQAVPYDVQAQHSGLGPQAELPVVRRAKEHAARPVAVQRVRQGGARKIVRGRMPRLQKSDLQQVRIGAKGPLEDQPALSRARRPVGARLSEPPATSSRAESLRTCRIP